MLDGRSAFCAGGRWRSTGGGGSGESDAERWRSKFCAGGCWRSTSGGGSGRSDVRRWRSKFLVGGWCKCKWR
eukprot:4800876-Pyramimonas_sp.AAC.1